MAFILDEELQNITNIKVIGVGGGGRHYYARNIYQDLSNRGIGVLFLLKAESEIISLLSFLGIGLLCDPGTLYTGD